jgi:ketosteroid isomerase-like protein
VEKLLTGLLAKVPDFRFKNLTYFIQTPDKVAAEYQVEAKVLSTGKIYKQTYAGVLHAENGKIKLLHETLDTLAASKAFSKD